MKNILYTSTKNSSREFEELKSKFNNFFKDEKNQSKKPFSKIENFLHPLGLSEKRFKKYSYLKRFQFI